MISIRDVANSSELDTDHWSSICDLTLTLRQGYQADNGVWTKMDEIQCSDTFAAFMHRLNRAVYGNAFQRFGKRIRVVPVVEKEAFGRWHIHAAVEPPGHISLPAFAALIERSWAKVDWGYKRILFRTDADNGWVGYMLKKRQKSKLETWFDCIVWESLHNPSVDA